MPRGHLAARSQAGIGPRRRGGELAVRVCDQHGAMPCRPHPEDRDEHLVLTATPRARRVDVQREHQRGAAPSPEAVA